MRISKSKRLWISLISLIVNYIVIVYAISKQADLQDLGLCFSMSNIPILGYILAESWKPSQINLKQNETDSIIDGNYAAADQLQSSETIK